MSPSVKSFLKKNQGRVRLLEAHNQETKETIRQTKGNDGQSFDGIWLSGLTQTTYLGIPDTELITPLQRAVLMSSANNNTKQYGRRPLCAAFDADSGGDIEDIPRLVSVLSSLGVSMVIIEDKSVSAPGQKVNSLAGASHSQGQADMYEFAEVLRAFRAAAGDSEILVTARIESFTTREPEKDKARESISVKHALDDALTRAKVYRSAGADAIMIHSKSKSPSEVLSFLTQFRSTDSETPLVVVPTTYGSATEDELHEAGANVVIYANHLMRAKITVAGAASDFFLASNPGFSFGEKELDSALQCRNFGFLMQKLAKTKNLSEAAREYRSLAERYTLMNMKTVTKALLDGRRADAVDNDIITAKELLKVNSHLVTDLPNLLSGGKAMEEEYRARL